MIGGKPRPQHRDAACRDVAVVGVAIVFGRKLRVELGGQLMFDRNWRFPKLGYDERWDRAPVPRTDPGSAER